MRKWCHGTSSSGVDGIFSDSYGGGDVDNEEELALVGPRLVVKAKEGADELASRLEGSIEGSIAGFVVVMIDDVEFSNVGE